MGRLFSVISTMAFVMMMIAVPLVAVFGLPQINPPFKELGEKLKETAMNKIRGTMVSDQDQISDPESPLYGLDTKSAPLEEAAAWGETANNGQAFDQFSKNQAGQQPAGNITQTSFQQNSGQGMSVNPAVFESTSNQLNSDGNKPPLMKTVMEQQSGRNLNTAPNTPAAFSRSVPSRQPSGMNQAPEQRPTLSFTQATRILQEMGIKDYSLEPGAQPDQFYFVCLYTLPDNPSVTTRFEAEANDPMIAVENVIMQIRRTLQPRATMSATSAQPVSSMYR